MGGFKYLRQPMDSLLKNCYTNVTISIDLLKRNSTVFKLELNWYFYCLSLFLFNLLFNIIN